MSLHEHSKPAYTVVRYDARSNKNVPVSKVYVRRDPAFSLAKKMNSATTGAPFAVSISTIKESVAAPAYFGAIYGDPDTPSFITPEGLAVFMWRKGQKVRYFTADGVQVGPEHSNVFPAMCSAHAAGWIDPRNPFLSMACRKELEGMKKQP